jgi:serine/threonine protein kinase
VELLECMQSVAPQRSYAPPPRRILTSDARSSTRGGWENALQHAIVAVGDLVRTGPGDDACVYQVTASLGSGTFASVYSCRRVDGQAQNGEQCADGELRPGALKVVRNSPAYAMQALQELRILRLLNEEHDPDDTHHIVRVRRAFTYRHHICFVFEPLGCSLLDLIAGSGYRGLPLQQVRPLMTDLLDAMEVLAAANVVHADVKPENVLLVPEPEGASRPHLKLIDFGSAVITTDRGEDKKPSHYHQSRFYRAPEVVVGAAQHSMKPGIDLWSCGCIAAELYLGLPIFPGTNEYQQLFRIQEIVGNPPDDVLRCSARTDTFFDSIVVRSTRRHTFKLKPPEAFGSREADVERYFEERDLFSLINNHSEIVPSDMRSVDATQRRRGVVSSDLDDNCLEDNERSLAKRINGERLTHADEEVRQDEALWVKAFAHFICGLVDADPRRRWTAAQVSSHPFVTGVGLATAMIWHPVPPRRHGSDANATQTPVSRGDRVAVLSSSAPSHSHMSAVSSTPSPWFGGGGLKEASGFSSQPPVTPIMGCATSAMAAAVAATNLATAAEDAMGSATAIDKAERRWKQQPMPRMAAGAAHVVLKQFKGGVLAGQFSALSSTSCGDLSRGYDPGYTELLRRIESRRGSNTA